MKPTTLYTGATHCIHLQKYTRKSRIRIHNSDEGFPYGSRSGYGFAGFTSHKHLLRGPTSDLYSGALDAEHADNYPYNIYGN